MKTTVNTATAQSHWSFCIHFGRGFCSLSAGACSEVNRSVTLFKTNGRNPLYEVKTKAALITGSGQLFVYELWPYAGYSL